MWDASNGAACPILALLLPRLSAQGAAQTAICDEPDPDFRAHPPDPTRRENLGLLAAALAESKAAFGLCFDGDADRLGVLARNGRLILGDELLLLYARAVLAEHPGATVVCDIKTSRSILRAIEAAGGRPVLGPSGHSLIRAQLNRLGAPLAGEVSGHYFFADRFYGHDDALYAAMRLFSALHALGLTLDAFVDSLPQTRTTPSLLIPCQEQEKAPAMARLAAACERLAKSGGLKGELLAIDGLRFESEAGMWMARASNTEPHLMLRVESESDSGFAALASRLTELLHEAGLQPPDGLS